MGDNITFVPLKSRNIENLTAIMKRAFDEDSRIHLGRETGGPPGYDDGSFLRKWGLDPNATSFEIYKDNKLVGGIILWLHSTGENHLGCIFLDVDLENKGIGTTIWRM
ncbi:MAG TPA: GNAT family N-acetyltransferase, partial [Armatimonadota bacterium]|nr:GNAT family N-acetyltransferase [Armatimonadota bacterium]